MPMDAALSILIYGLFVGKKRFTTVPTAVDIGAGTSGLG